MMSVLVMEVTGGISDTVIEGSNVGDEGISGDDADFDGERIQVPGVELQTAHRPKGGRLGLSCFCYAYCSI